MSFSGHLLRVSLRIPHFSSHLWVLRVLPREVGCLTKLPFSILLAILLLSSHYWLWGFHSVSFAEIRPSSPWYCIWSEHTGFTYNNDLSMHADGTLKGQQQQRHAVGASSSACLLGGESVCCVSLVVRRDWACAMESYLVFIVHQLYNGLARNLPSKWKSRHFMSVKTEKHLQFFSVFVAAQSRPERCQKAENFPAVWLSLECTVQAWIVNDPENRKSIEQGREALGCHRPARVPRFPTRVVLYQNARVPDMAEGLRFWRQPRSPSIWPLHRLRRWTLISMSGQKYRVHIQSKQGAPGSSSLSLPDGCTRWSCDVFRLSSRCTISTFD